ncbi:pyridoxal phosphate-dependent aminotransferase [Vagococcus sp. BWB3-3]|uniref:cysteine-S-conjugate beta-lyase n=1 Tax=Vagococcus allomyrinae TaxID=2794353 RepID=A0A940PB69_9ENTE|nr:MalY/PatB family protein [Vagococcus allomyrinae]MBP1042946.1 pyridoxal phosphate-dependent aminotransferase [Vagococcus allomyrinae]
MKMTDFVNEYAVDRLKTNSLKWDALDVRYGDPDLIAMWVADMEFKVPKEVQAALNDRVNHGVFGYSYTPDSYYQALINWQQKRHHATIQKDWVRFSTGIVTALYWFVNIFTKENDAVMIQTPVYYPFHNAVKDNNRQLVTSELINTDGSYTMDLADVEAKIISEKVKLFILCSPHNPVGRVWTATELEALLAICHKHQVLVISDEIHQDIVLGNRQFISSLSIANGKYQDNLIVCSAPSKTFNLACLLNSHIIIPNESIRAHYDVETNKINQTETSIMGQIACEAAYTHGEDWLEGLLSVIEFNFNYLKTELNQHAPKAIVTELEGTYLAWIDLRAYVPVEETKHFIQDKCRLAIDFGEWFSDECQGFVRLNMGTDPKYVKAGIANIITEIHQL